MLGKRLPAVQVGTKLVEKVNGAVEPPGVVPLHKIHQLRLQ